MARKEEYDLRSDEPYLVRDVMGDEIFEKHAEWKKMRDEKSKKEKNKWDKEHQKYLKWKNLNKDKILQEVTARAKQDAKYYGEKRGKLSFFAKLILFNEVEEELNAAQAKAAELKGEKVDWNITWISWKKYKIKLRKEIVAIRIDEDIVHKRCGTSEEFESLKEKDLLSESEIKQLDKRLYCYRCLFRIR